MRRLTWKIGLPIALVLLFFALRATVFAPKPIPVTVEAVDRGPVESTVTNSQAGTIKTRRRARLSPEVGGQVAELPFREGDRVKAGDLLLRLEDSTQRAQLTLTQRDVDAARAERERACITAERAGRELERSRSLAEDELLSTDMLDQFESGKRAADAACAAGRANEGRARAAVQVAQTGLDHLLLRAPFDGVVAEVSIQVGEWTTPSPPAMPVPPVLDVLDPSSIYVSAPMDEVDSQRVATGLPVRITVDSHRGETFAGRVTRVAPYVLDVQAQNRTVEIEVELDDTSAGPFLPGTSADVEVILEVRDEALRVPTAALMEGGRVLVLAGDRLEERIITPGLKNWDFTEVAEGLSESDEIVTSLDRAEVVAGALVEVAETQPSN